MTNAIEGMNIIAVLFIFALVILWALLPFAVFGIKGRLDQMLEQSNRLSRQLEQLTGKPAPDTRHSSAEESGGWG
ncbi:MAG: hypothetical protein CMN85_10990 [Spongiibacteraceae bacterium]|uniref:hypothetical protein n=1 Tax=uncultured Haliea sp. TaxID=622616 RepID=UPI000C6AD52E|nr:hypothetical protein [Spongiibacteraceae bacterium]|tara:strand:- start:7497 stop:7721 length:225 start_codon:yes stop_codon:yes gene_type:complete